MSRKEHLNTSSQWRIHAFTSWSPLVLFRQWNRNIVTLTNFSSLAVLEGQSFTTFSTTWTAAKFSSGWRYFPIQWIYVSIQCKVITCTNTQSLIIRPYQIQFNPHPHPQLLRIDEKVGVMTTLGFQWNIIRRALWYHRMSSPSWSWKWCYICLFITVTS